MEIIRGKIGKAQKVTLYGPEGIGKSTFASQFPEAIFIDTEGGSGELDVSRLPRPSSWAMLLLQVEYVKQNKGICKTLIIDTADWAEMLCKEHVCAKLNVKGIEDPGYGKGYVYLEEEFGRLLNKLEEVIEVGINVVVTAHAEIKKIEQPEEIGGFDHWQLKLEKKTMPLLKEWSDILLFANYKVYVVNVDNQGAAKGKNKAQGGKRVMYTSHTPWWDAKNRHGLADELPFEYSAIAHCIPVGSARSAPAAPVAQPTRAAEVKAPETAKAPEAKFVELETEEAPQFEVQAPAKSTEPEPKAEVKLDEAIPRALADLMQEHKISEWEIRLAVATKGYYPEDTPIKNYDPDFINGVLVGAWDQVHGIIKNFNDVPF